VPEVFCEKGDEDEEITVRSDPPQDSSCENIMLWT